MRPEVKALFDQLPSGDCNHERFSVWGNDDKIESVECDDCGAEVWSKWFISLVEEARRGEAKSRPFEEFLKEHEHEL